MQFQQQISEQLEHILGSLQLLRQRIHNNLSIFKQLLQTVRKLEAYCNHPQQSHLSRLSSYQYRIKSCVFNITIKQTMLIRHISIPRHTHLAPLSEPKTNPQIDEPNDYTNYFTKTLNPQHPIRNTLISQKQGPLNSSTKELIDNSFSYEAKEQLLSKQFPQKIEQLSANWLFSRSKQNYKNQSLQVENLEHNYNKNYIKSRFPTFSTYTPQLNNNAYLNQNYEPNQQTHANMNNFCYMQSGSSDQSEQVINNNHANKMIRNREVYRTLEKFKMKNKADQIDSPIMKTHKKYTFEPPKQKFSCPQQQINQPLQKQSQRKHNKLQPLSGKSMKSYVSNPNIPEKHKKLLPDQQSEPDNNGIVFRRQNRKSFSLRKTSEQEKAPLSTPKSQIHLSNKKLKEASSAKRTSEKNQSTRIEISYRTSLSRVRQVCQLNSIENYSIIMKIPQIFAYPLFSGNQSQQELFNKAEETLKHLQIAQKGISLKKYSNCVVIISGSLGLVWHYNGKVYFGGWKHQVFDQGAKQGLGLQWVPKKYVYYGEFVKNKREGVGIMKTCDNQLLAGLWRDNHFIRSLAINREAPFGVSQKGRHQFNQ